MPPNKPVDSLEKILHEEMLKVLNKGFNDKSELLNNLDQIKMVAGWYREAKEDPKQIPAIILNAALEKTLNSVVSFLGNTIVNSISAKIDIRKNELAIEELEIDFSLKPYVEYVKKLNSAESAKVKMTFEIGISGELHNVRIGKENHDVQIERFVGLLNISIINIEVKLIVVSGATLSLPIHLCSNQLFDIKDMSFILSLARVSPV